MKKRLLCLLMAAVFALGLAPVTALGATVEDSGICSIGDNTTLRWSLNSDGVLTVSGAGTMAPYARDNPRAPWYSRRNAIKTVVIEGGNNIGSYAFFDCKNLTSVSFLSSNSSMKTIEDWAFGDCTSLTSVTIPTSVETIEAYAFYDCAGLTDVHYSGTWAQWNNISINGGNQPLNNAAIYYSDWTGSCGGEEGGTNLSWTLNSKGVLTIRGTGPMGNYTDSSVPWNSWQQKIETLVIEPGVTTIGDNAFAFCSRLTSVRIPSSVTRIGNSAFFHCTGLTGMDLPDGVTGIGNCAFQGCTGLTGVRIPGTLGGMGSQAFQGCTALTGVDIAEGAASVGDYAFQDCTALTGVRIPGSMANHMGQGAFQGCTGLISAVFEDGVTTVAFGAFENCASLTAVGIPASLTSIKNNAFDGCGSLTDVYFEGSQDRWKKVSIGNYGNDTFKAAERHYDSALQGAGRIGTGVSWDVVTDSEGTKLRVQGAVSAAQPVLAAVYQDGKMTGLTWMKAADTALLSGGDSAKVFWMDAATCAPLGANGSVALPAADPEAA